MNMLVIFITLTILNVVIQTVKSIATIKCGKTVASLINAVAYGLYTYVIFFTSSEGLDLHAKAVITAIANLIGVYIVKWAEEKARKDKLWRIEMTLPSEHTATVHQILSIGAIPHNYIENIGKYTIFNCYCATQAESTKVKHIVDQYGAKYFVSESKTL